jgi:SecD/SecF fusion protein
VKSVRYNLRFDFVGHRKWYYSFSVAVTLIGIVSLILFGLNYGVDFRAGSSVDISSNQNVNEEQIKQYLADEGYVGKQEPIVRMGAERITIRFTEVLTDEEETKLKADYQERFDPNASFEVNTVDVEMARELQWNAIIAVLVASVGIAIYVSIRFEWRFAVGAIVSTLHDAFLVITAFSIFRWEVNLPFIIALLTIIGYSINDTIVIFDRIRENLRFGKQKTAEDLAQLVNQSIWQTLTRSINTVVTVLIAAVLLLVLGSEPIRLFSLAMVIGLTAGAYSSIFIASQIWFDLRKRKKFKASPAAKTS